MNIPRTNIKKWIVWRFSRYNGPPISYTITELQEDCLYDCFNHTEHKNKQSLIKELNNALKELVISTDKLKIENGIITADFK